MKRMSLVVGLALACVIILGSGTADARQIPSGGPNATRLVAGLERAATSGDAVTVWNANAGVAATLACIAPLNDPLHESRIYAMMHVAIHDALNAIDRRSRPYALDLRVEPGASPDAAVAAAARDVLVPLIRQLPLELLPTPDCIDDGVASVEAAYTAALALIPDGPAKEQGIAVGQAAAAAILDLRAADGAVGPFLNFNCPQDTNPGEYQCTPGTPFIAFELWENVTPFVLKDSSQFRPGPPYAVNKKKYTADFNEVKRLGGDGIEPSARTADQTEIALFWLESSPLKWNRIARTVSADKGLDLWENARLFGLLNLALADGYIAMVDTKNHYNYWRPVTAIRTANTDGNPDTTGDPTWTPLRSTPPNQDYASGHAIEGGAGAEVLKQFFGTDRISFQDCGVILPAGSNTCSDPTPVLRSYTSFSQAAVENAYSRILVGFHFRNSVEVGTDYGRKIGKRAANLYLRPVH